MATQEQYLKKYFGYDSFRAGQGELVDALLGGRDALGIMPTGAGKSICFQLPALMLDGITLVISPLISLMKDQVGALIASGVPAAYLNSSLSPRQIDLALQYATAGKYKIIYVAPERLLTPNFLRFTQTVHISMVTVDEAHCISQWGQDFRPSYTQIPAFIATLPHRPILSAFTATATKRVRDDILAALQLRSPKVLVTSFDRKNLFFEVRQPKDKRASLLYFLSSRRAESGIIYCLSRKNVEEICDFLNEHGHCATRYHAGLAGEERQKNQDDFLYDRTPIMVATNAFGMGIDKSNVSFVVHFNMPKDMESYYQEAGRAGRDGTAAHCLLLYGKGDVRTHQWMFDNNDERQLLPPELQTQLRAQDEHRLHQMAIYSTTKSCNRQYILRYFGEYITEPCGNCGNCLPQQQEEIESQTRQPRMQKNPATTVAPERQQLYQNLCDLRQRIAQKQGVPAYALFGSSTIIDLCDKLPQTPSDLLDISGISERKADRYGRDILTIIHEFSQN